MRLNICKDKHNVASSPNDRANAFLLHDLGAQYFQYLSIKIEVEKLYFKVAISSVPHKNMKFKICNRKIFSNNIL